MIVTERTVRAPCELQIVGEVFLTRVLTLRLGLMLFMLPLSVRTIIILDDRSTNLPPPQPTDNGTDRLIHGQGERDAYRSGRLHMRLPHR